MAKSSRLGAKGSFVIRERKVKSFIVSVRRHSACSAVSGALTELCSMVKCALWGLRGRTPLQGHTGVCMYPLRFSRAACPRHDQKRCVMQQPGDVRTRYATRSQLLAVRLNVFRDF